MNYLKKIEDFKPSFFWYLSAFLFFFVSRLFIIKYLDIDSTSVYSDIQRYLTYSDQILRGNFNLAVDFFIPAPLHYYILALFKLIFYENWINPYLLFQLTLLSTSSIYIYKLSELIFEKGIVAILSWLIYFFYLPTSWFVAYFLQENNFQCFFIFFIYYFLKSLKSGNMNYLILSSILFSITFHIKSHILIFSLFIPIIILFYKNLSLSKRFIYIFTISIVSLISTIPYGYYNLKANDTYVLGSTGSAVMFFVSYSDDAYNSIVDIPPKNSQEWKNLKSGKSNTWEKINKKIDSNLSQKEKDQILYKEAINWVKKNPYKTIKLKFSNLYNFLMPGVNINWYDTKVWAANFVISLPIYLFAYISIFKNSMNNIYLHFWIISLFFTMLIFNLIFIPQYRFNVITLEPYYIIFCSQGIYSLMNYILDLKKTSNLN